jgi:hypothetical protein
MHKKAPCADTVAHEPTDAARSWNNATAGLTRFRRPEWLIAFTRWPTLIHLQTQRRRRPQWQTGVASAGST